MEQIRSIMVNCAPQYMMIRILRRIKMELKLFKKEGINIIFEGRSLITDCLRMMSTPFQRCTGGIHNITKHADGKEC
jgi:hypothetical protein